jgi:hypothetical protein
VNIERNKQQIPNKTSYPTVEKEALNGFFKVAKTAPRITPPLSL